MFDLSLQAPADTEGSRNAYGVAHLPGGFEEQDAP